MTKSPKAVKEVKLKTMKIEVTCREDGTVSVSQAIENAETQAVAHNTALEVERTTARKMLPVLAELLTDASSHYNNDELVLHMKGAIRTQSPSTTEFEAFKAAKACIQSLKDSGVLRGQQGAGGVGGTYRGANWDDALASLSADSE